MRGKRVNKMIIGFVVLVVAIIALVMVFFPPSKGEMPQFRDENGQILPGSIAEKCYVEVDGEKLGIFLLAKDVKNPVLLVCGGGPGISQYLLESFYPSTLADEFVVCYVEYRGTGLSYHSDIEIEDMTEERYLADVAAITEYLQERFSQEKIYILGHSFGSYIALRTVQLYPEKYHAYIAMSQMCNTEESEYRAYDYMKEQYELLGNDRMVKKFEEFPIRESKEIYNSYIFGIGSVRDKAMHELGGGTARDMKSVITGILLPSMKCTAFTWQERINIWRSKIASHRFPVAHKAFHVNVFEEVPSLQLPVYFLAGQYDYTTCYSLQKEYYERLEAPKKEFYTFENSAHSPLYEEPELAREILGSIKN